MTRQKAISEDKAVEWNLQEELWASGMDGDHEVTRQGGKQCNWWKQEDNIEIRRWNKYYTRGKKNPKNNVIGERCPQGRI